MPFDWPNWKSRWKKVISIKVILGLRLLWSRIHTCIKPLSSVCPAYQQHTMTTQEDEHNLQLEARYHAHCAIYCFLSSIIIVTLHGEEHPTDSHLVGGAC